MEWVGVVSAVSVGILTAISFVWSRWRKTMQDLLENQAEGERYKNAMGKILKKHSDEEKKENVNK